MTSDLIGVGIGIGIGILQRIVHTEAEYIPRTYKDKDSGLGMVRAIPNSHPKPLNQRHVLMICQNAKSLRRLAADHSALHNQDLPPYFLFPSNTDRADDLTQLDILLCGPPATPFAAGVWKLHLSIPPQYPQQPPTANFRTPIFHPNVDPATGAVCVETLKRDWDSKLTLRDILVTISCLLVYPNPDSALNAEAGALIQEGFEAFARRAELMTSIHARIQPAMVALVKEAQSRGQDLAEAETDDREVPLLPQAQDVPTRRRRTIARVRGRVRPETETSPTGAPIRGREQEPRPTAPSARPPFVLQTGNDDVFGSGSILPRPAQRVAQVAPFEESMDLEEDDVGMADLEQENDLASPVSKPTSTARDARTPRRPHGAPVPLGELFMPEQDTYDTSVGNIDMESEYPPSPTKSASRSPAKQQIQSLDFPRPESSREAALRRIPNITPPNIADKPLAMDSPFGPMSVSPRKRLGRSLFDKQPLRNTTPEIESSFLQNSFFRSARPERVSKTKSPKASDTKRQQQQREDGLNAKLWELCGRDIKRWNRGDFGSEIFQKKAGRW